MADGGAGNTASIKFSTGGNTERMRIDSSGNVGIGTSSPSEKLSIVGAGNGTSFSNTTASTAYNQATVVGNAGGSVKVGVDNNIGTAFNSGNYGGSIQSTNNLAFSAGGAERMRIDSSGNFLVGTTSSSGGKLRVEAGAGSYPMWLYKTDTADVAAAIIQSARASGGTGATMLYFMNSTGGGAGAIVSTGSSTSYNTSSDYRLKEDLQPMTGASARVQALKPVNFAWKDGGHRVDGFLAHEAQEVVPEAVHGTKDAMRDEEYEVTPAVYEDVVIPAVLDDDGNELEAERTEQRLVAEAVMGTRSVPDYQGIDQSKLVPLLTAALQEALTKIDDMETRLAALEGK
jgi:hypothetical protein